MSDVVVVDASLALKWVLIEEDSDIAKMLLSRWIDEGKEIRAPALLATLGMVQMYLTVS
jgi:predicted nucleic acid-binding protein